MSLRKKKIRKKELVRIYGTGKSLVEMERYEKTKELERIYGTGKTPLPAERELPQNRSLP